MNLNLYHILSHLIPGLLIYVALLFAMGLEPEHLPALSATAIAYVLGYFINAIASWMESLFFFTWGGKPSRQLLEGGSCGRITFSETKRVKKILIKEFGEKDPSDDQLFSVAMRIANSEERVKDMNANYAFSRALLTATILGSLILFGTLIRDPLLGLMAFIIVAIAWHRAKERAFYYAREVLMVVANK